MFNACSHTKYRKASCYRTMLHEVLGSKNAVQTPRPHTTAFEGHSQLPNKMTGLLLASQLP